jgi:transcriptional regulator with XRE-family HTH domain
MEFGMTAKKLDKERGRRLADHRDRLGLTQTQVAERIGVKDVVVSRHERGYGLSATSLMAYAKLYNVLPESILGEDAAMPQASTSAAAAAGVTADHHAALQRFLNDGRCNPLTGKEMQHVLRHLAAGESDEIDDLEIYLLGYRHYLERTDESLNKLRAATKRSWKKSGQATLKPATPALLPAGKRTKPASRPELAR